MKYNLNYENIKTNSKVFLQRNNLKKFTSEVRLTHYELSTHQLESSVALNHDDVIVISSGLS